MTGADRRENGTTLALAAGPAAFGIASIVAGVVSIARHGWSSPRWGGLLYDPDGRFLDLADPVDGVLTGHPFAQFTTSHGVVFPSGINYPPGSVPVLRLFGLIGLPASHVAICVITALVLGALTWWVTLRGSPKRWRTGGAVLAGLGPIALIVSLDHYAAAVVIIGSAALALSGLGVRGRTQCSTLAWVLVIAWSFPVAFALDRMNIDLVVFAVMAGTVVLYNRKRRSMGAIGVGLAVALKLYPIILVVLEPSTTRAWKRWILALGTAAAFTAIGITMSRQTPFEVMHGFRGSLTWVDQAYIVGPDGLPYGASGFTGAKALYVQLTGQDPTAFAATLYRVWKPLSPLALGALCGLAILLRLPTWQRLTIATAALLLLSPISSDYRVVVMVLPATLFVRSLLIDRIRSGSTIPVVITAATFGVTFAPKTLWLISQPYLTTETLFGPVPLAILLVVAFAYRPRFEARDG